MINKPTYERQNTCISINGIITRHSFAVTTRASRVTFTFPRFLSDFLQSRLEIELPKSDLAFSNNDPRDTGTGSIGLEKYCQLLGCSLARAGPGNVIRGGAKFTRIYFIGGSKERDVINVWIK